MKFDDMPWERGAPAPHEPKAQRMFRIGGQAIIRFYNAATDEENLTAVTSLSEILRQIDEGGKAVVFTSEAAVFC